jgi:hypothetical protein
LADKVAGKVKAAAGGLLGRPDLAEDGELQQSKAAQAEEAARLEAQAEQAADEADARAELEANAVDQARVDAEVDQAGRLEGIDRQQDEAQTRARAWADRQREARSRHDAAEQAALDRQEESIEAGGGGQSLPGRRDRTRGRGGPSSGRRARRRPQEHRGPRMSLRPNRIPDALALGLWTARLPLTVAEKVLALERFRLGGRAVTGGNPTGALAEENLVVEAGEDSAQFPEPSGKDVSGNCE